MINPVIKIGGSTLSSDNSLESIASQIASLCKSGLTPILVHGAGPHISARMIEKGLVPRFDNGLRITDHATLQVVIEELNLLNEKIADCLSGYGIAINACSAQSKIFLSKKAVNHANIDLGFVGEIESVDTKVFPADKVSIVAPVGFDEQGQRYNINADHAAMALSAALKAEALIFLSDVEGIMLDLDDRASLIAHIGPDHAESLISNGSIKGGMIQKVLNSLTAIKLGVRRVCITDGRRSGTLIEAALNQLIHGTTFSATY